MKHIKQFQNKSDYTSYVRSSNFVNPNLSRCIVENHPQYDYDSYYVRYFTIKARESGTLYLWYAQDYEYSGYLEYSIDNGQNWTRVTNVDGEYVEVHTSLASGACALIRGENLTLAYEPWGISKGGGFSFGDYIDNTWTNKHYDVYGNIMSLLYGSNFENAVSFSNSAPCSRIFFGLFSEQQVVNAKNLILPATTLTTGCYSSMFYGCSSLTKAPKLPATTLTESCYQEMFYGCTSLTTAPNLLATTLADDCYNNMFASCTSLITTPALPATKLKSGCYSGMFSGCTGLTSAPVLPAITLTLDCYKQMFMDCTGLTSTPALPATTLASGCYNYMFYGCSTLTTAPTLNATTLTPNCYNGMFYNCTGLTSAPTLPATTLATGCYQNMFYGCSTLTTAPALNATTLAGSCYSGMFYNCTGLTTAPALPATTLASGCYSSMFRGCTGLTTAPELPATKTVNMCYQNMFRNCTNLNYIKCLISQGTLSTNDVGNWVNGVSATGTFVKAENMYVWFSGVSGIPSGWTVETV